MPERLVAKFQKLNACFDSAEAAQQDRKQFFSDELKTQLSRVYQDLKSSGIIISGPHLTWDQSTQVLTIERVVRNHQEYRDYFHLNNISTRNEVESASQAAGWTRIDFAVVPVDS